MIAVTEMFALTQPLGELVARSVTAFLALVVLVRLVPKRNAGHISPNDMLILIVIGSVGAAAIVGDASSVGDVTVMIAGILGLGYMLDLAEDRVPFLRRLLRHRQTLLIKDGKLLRRNMRHEMITREELEAVLRREGVEDVSGVALATLEADGEISLIKRGEAEGG